MQHDHDSTVEAVFHTPLLASATSRVHITTASCILIVLPLLRANISAKPEEHVMKRMTSDAYPIAARLSKGKAQSLSLISRCA